MIKQNGLEFRPMFIIKDTSEHREPVLFGCAHPHNTGSLFYESQRVKRNPQHALDMSSTLIGLPAVILLVLANGFFVAAEFSLVAVRRSRVTELADQGRVNARILDRTVGRLDASLAATQLG